MHACDIPCRVSKMKKKRKWNSKIHLSILTDLPSCYKLADTSRKKNTVEMVCSKCVMKGECFKK